MKSFLSYMNLFGVQNSPGKRTDSPNTSSLGVAPRSSFRIFLRPSKTVGRIRVHDEPEVAGHLKLALLVVVFALSLY